MPVITFAAASLGGMVANVAMWIRFVGNPDLRMLAPLVLMSIGFGIQSVWAGALARVTYREERRRRARRIKVPRAVVFGRRKS